LDDLGLAATTNIVITADHGFATVSKESATSPAAKASYPDVVPDFLPRGFLAIDIAKALDLPLFDPDNHNARVGENAAPRVGNGVIGKDAETANFFSTSARASGQPQASGGFFLR
jgi:hypothetical protein